MITAASAALVPATRGSVWLAPPAGSMPTRASGSATTQSSAAMRTSHCSASSNPNPTALPCIDAIMGTGTARRSPHTSRAQRASRMANNDGAVPNSARSAPAEKWSPVARNTTTRTSGSARTAVSTSHNASRVATS